MALAGISAVLGDQVAVGTSVAPGRAEVYSRPGGFSVNE